MEALHGPIGPAWAATNLSPPPWALVVFLGGLGAAAMLGALLTVTRARTRQRHALRRVSGVLDADISALSDLLAATGDGSAALDALRRARQSRAELTTVEGAGAVTHWVNESHNRIRERAVGDGLPPSDSAGNRSGFESTATASEAAPMPDAPPNPDSPNPDSPNPDSPNPDSPNPDSPPMPASRPGPAAGDAEGLGGQDPQSDHEPGAAPRRVASAAPAPPRSSCLIDPRHGASTTSVLYAPIGTRRLRLSPVCDACSAVFADGGLPPARLVPRYDGLLVPYWQAGPEYTSYAYGYLAALGSTMPVVLSGTILGADLSAGDYGVPRPTSMRDRDAADASGALVSGALGGVAH